MGGRKGIQKEIEMSKGHMTERTQSSRENGVHKRRFLVVVDSSKELNTALHFACRRALKTNGQVALFHALEPTNFRQLAKIEELMETEARSEAEQLLQRIAADARRQTGQMPIIYLREGNTIEQLIEVIKNEGEISVLVLGAGTGDDGPGPLVSELSNKLTGQIKLPVTIVPGNLTNEQIDDLT